MLRAVVHCAVGLALIVSFAGCFASATDGRLVTTRAPGVETIPVSLAVYPLLSTEPAAGGGRPADSPRPLQTTRTGDGVYLQPPTRTELMVTAESQLLTDLFEAELSYAGFQLKALPVQRTGGEVAADGSFGLGLDLLRRLHGQYGLDAVVVGNVHFVREREYPGEPRVAAGFLRLIDIATLDVLAHVTLDRGQGLAPEVAARALAGELARLAATAEPPGWPGDAEDPQAPDAGDSPPASGLR